MKKVNVSELKARLSHYLKLVKSGSEVLVLDRNLPIAKLICLQPELSAPSSLAIEKSSMSIEAALKASPKIERRVNQLDSVTMLLEDRDR